MIEDMHEADFVELFERFWEAWPKGQIIQGKDYVSLASEVAGIWLFVQAEVGPRKGIYERTCAIDSSKSIVAERLLVAEGDESLVYVLLPLREMRCAVRREKHDPLQVCLEAIVHLQQEIERSPQKILRQLQRHAESGIRSSLSAVSGGLPGLGVRS